MSILDWVQRRNKIAFLEIELHNKVNIQIRSVDRLGFECLCWRECDNNLTRGEWRILKCRPDDVRPRRTEWWGCFARGDRFFQINENVDATVVFDLEVGYTVHSDVREQYARQMSGCVNAQAIV